MFVSRAQTGSGDGSECEPCHIQLDERLIKSYPIWFLPDLQRSGAVHLLQGKDEGVGDSMPIHSVTTGKFQGLRRCAMLRCVIDKF